MGESQRKPNTHSAEPAFADLRFNEPGRTKRQVVGVLFLIAMLVVVWIPQLDTMALKEIDSGFKRALLTFGIAKGLNGAISLAQSIQLSVQLGVGVSLTIGELLDPINDLVEQFCSFMLMATVAFGVQKILLTLGSYVVVKGLLSAAIGLWIVYILCNRRTPKWLINVSVVILMIRFAMPVVSLGSTLVFETFLSDGYESSQSMMAEATDKVNQLTMQHSGSESQKASKWWSAALPDLEAIMDHFQKTVKAITDKVTGDIVDLMVIFLLQTLILPIGMLWLMYKMALKLFD